MTLTITTAKKNLSKWLQAAARGKDIGIVSGADVIALRKAEVESTDYPRREFGVTDEELDRFEARLDADYARLKKQGKLIVLTPEGLKEKLGR